MITLEEARGIWQRMIDARGGRCPCCNRFGKIYDRKLNSTMARSLVWLTKATVPMAYVNVPEALEISMSRTNQHPSLRWWGLVERPENGDEQSTKKYEGYWRVTPRGRAFVAGEITVPNRVWTYDGETIPNPPGAKIRMVTLADCFKTPFDYREIMATEYRQEAVAVVENPTPEADDVDPYMV